MNIRYVILGAIFLLSLTTVNAGWFGYDNGECEIFAAPYAVYLNDDDYNYVEPDISVICDRTKLDENLNENPNPPAMLGRIE